MWRVSLGIVIGVVLCVAGQIYGDTTVRHIMFLGGYVKASGILVDANGQKAVQ